MPSTISQIEFSRICGTSKQSVYKAIKAGKVKVNKARKVVFDDDLTQAWYQSMVAKKSAASVGTRLPTKDGEKSKITIISLTEQKIIQEIGKIRADKKLKELQLSIKRSQVIEKETTAAVLFHYLQALNINMLDMPDMVMDTLIDKIKSGKTRGELIKVMRDAIKKAIVSTKKQLKERLK